jgi:hypothetical protein
MAEAAVAHEDFLSPLDGGGVGNRAADEHIAARTGGRGGRGLGGKRSRGKQVQSRECFHATGYSFTFDRVASMIDGG